MVSDLRNPTPPDLTWYSANAWMKQLVVSSFKGRRRRVLTEEAVEVVADLDVRVFGAQDNADTKVIDTKFG